MPFLDEIAQQVRQCRRCRLCEVSHNTVPGEGNPSAEILFIGEAPGRQEDLLGRPFVGAAGKLLQQMLEVIGLKRTDVFITNIVKHRPPENRDPFPDEIEACSPYLKQQILIIQPKLIVTLGRHAMNTFLPGFKISEIHGKPKRAQSFFNKRQVFFPLYHPASALYNPGLKSVLFEDMKKIPALLNKILLEIKDFH